MGVDAQYGQLVMSVTAINKSAIAQNQLDRAISLYLDQSDFISAITLSRAAHELIRKLGERLTGVGDDTVDEFANLVVAVGAEDGLEIASKDIVHSIFHFPNQLKHHGEDDALSLRADWAEEAADMIGLAISAWFRSFGNVSAAMERFDQSRRA